MGRVGAARPRSIPYDVRRGGRARRRPARCSCRPPRTAIDETLDALDGLLFSGGGDLDPAHYGARGAREDRRGRARSATAAELALLAGALARDMPVLAICRGSQVLNVARGGDLVQHLPDVVGHERHRELLGRVLRPRRSRSRAASRLGALIGDARSPVKSHHHQGFGRIGEGSSRGRAGPTTARSRRSRIPRAGSRSACSGTPRRARTQRLFEALVEEARATARSGAAVTHRSLNPATEETIAELERAGVEETDAAVAGAKAAFPAWRAVAPADRARLLRRLATLVEEHREELARIESRERRQADRRRARRGRHGRAGLPLLRRRGRQALRRDDPGRRRRRHRRSASRSASSG